MPMKLLTIPGRLLAVPFWLAVLANLIAPFAAPFELLLNLAGAAMLLLHVLQLGVCHPRLQASARPTLDRLLLLLFGSFYLDALPSAASAAAPLPQATREAEAVLAEVAELSSRSEPHPAAEREVA
jgi:putative membrane protein